jgi:uncharacterized membrane protein
MRSRRHVLLGFCLATAIVLTAALVARRGIAVDGVSRRTLAVAVARTAGVLAVGLFALLTLVKWIVGQFRRLPRISAGEVACTSFTLAVIGAAPVTREYTVANDCNSHTGPVALADVPHMLVGNRAPLFDYPGGIQTLLACNPSVPQTGWAAVGWWVLGAAIVLAVCLLIRRRPTRRGVTAAGKHVTDTIFFGAQRASSTEDDEER